MSCPKPATDSSKCELESGGDIINTIMRRMSVFGCKADITDAISNVCFWHLADIGVASENVRSWG